jgi:hypothetical protein
MGGGFVLIIPVAAACVKTIPGSYSAPSTGRAADLIIPLDWRIFTSDAAGL